MFVLATMAATLTGCGSTIDGGVDISGGVTFYGSPALAEITFQRHDEDGQPVGRASTAMTDEQGRYTLLYNAESCGALLGTYQVTIKVLDVIGGKHTDDGKGNEETTRRLKVVKLERTIVDDTREFNFALTH
ncbi:MAG: hypothetical protein CMJ78_12715 [Planctomycetaceae bacterium]|nr:hypothetical protein [Planctomycetaceae bacterium]